MVATTWPSAWQRLVPSSGLLLLLWIVLLLSIASSNSLSFIPEQAWWQLTTTTTIPPRGGASTAERNSELEVTTRRSSSNSQSHPHGASSSQKPSAEKNDTETITTESTDSTTAPISSASSSLARMRGGASMNETTSSALDASQGIKEASTCTSSKIKEEDAADERDENLVSTDDGLPSSKKNLLTNDDETEIRGGEEPSSSLFNDSDWVDPEMVVSSSSSSSDAADNLSRKRRQFLDRIAVISDSWMRREQDATIRRASSRKSSKQEENDPVVLDSVTPQTDLSRPGRHIHIVTTAALPWFTGTAVNPLLRAAYLHRRTQQINNNSANNTTTTTTSNSTSQQQRWVTLMIPWLELPADQEQLYHHQQFENPQQQEDYIRDWLRNQADMPDVACPDTGLRLLFYPARYHAGLRSIFAMGDMLRVLEEDSSSNDGNHNATTTNLDVCILEEPEHVNWFRAPGDGWTQKFNYVVGIVHTNYKEYASSHYSGLWTAPAISIVSSAMVRAYCHKVIKLSDVLQTYAPEKETTSNVHGVRSEFLKEGMRRRALTLSRNSSDNNDDNESESASTSHNDDHDNKIYFIGKLLWAKGLDIMLDLEDYYKQCTGEYFAIDIYGSGPESTVIQKAFHGRGAKRRAADGDSSSPTNNKKRRRQRNGTSRSALLGTTLSIFGGSRRPAAPPSQQQHNENKQRKNRRRRARFGVGNGGADATTAAATDDSGNDEPSPSNYFDALPSLESFHEKARGHLARIKERIDAVDLPQTFSELRRRPIPAQFPGRVDHAELKDHKVFVNPSISEVLCTTTAEALAMGKFAIIPDHPSNKFFTQFPNCLPYRNKFEFVANLRWAMTHEPEPLSPELARTFSWEAATDRLIAASAITVRETLQLERLGRSRLDERIAWFHNELGKGATGDMLRRICGAGPVSEQVRYAKDQDNLMASISSGMLTRDDDEDVDDEDGAEDEDDGLSKKFRRSSFAEAIRTTLGEMSIQ